METGVQALYQGADMLAPSGGRSPPEGDISVISLQKRHDCGGDGGDKPDGQIHSVFLTVLPGHADNADYHGKYAGSFTLSSEFRSTDFGKALPSSDDASSDVAITVPQGFGSSCEVKKKKPKVMWKCPRCGQQKSAGLHVNNIFCPSLGCDRQFYTTNKFRNGNLWRMSSQAESAQRLFSSASASASKK